jgi:hypothetical protein
MYTVRGRWWEGRELGEPAGGEDRRVVLSGVKQARLAMNGSSSGWECLDFGADALAGRLWGKSSSDRGHGAGQGQ